MKIKSEREPKREKGGIQLQQIIHLPDKKVLTHPPLPTRTSIILQLDLPHLDFLRTHILRGEELDRIVCGSCGCFEPRGYGGLGRRLAVSWEEDGGRFGDGVCAWEDSGGSFGS
jgi:hypothetical protein